MHMLEGIFEVNIWKIILYVGMTNTFTSKVFVTVDRIAQVYFISEVCIGIFNSYTRIV